MYPEPLKIKINQDNPYIPIRPIPSHSPTVLSFSVSRLDSLSPSSPIYHQFTLGSTIPATGLPFAGIYNINGIYPKVFHTMIIHDPK